MQGSAPPPHPVPAQRPPQSRQQFDAPQRESQRLGQVQSPGQLPQSSPLVMGLQLLSQLQAQPDQASHSQLALHSRSSETTSAQQGRLSLAAGLHTPWPVQAPNAPHWHEASQVWVAEPQFPHAWPLV